MPGKQMAIDADLNAGLIDEQEAREAARADPPRGRLLRRDGRRHPFTQRDAMAAMLITGVNIVAGLVIGVFQHGMRSRDAARPSPS